MASTLNSAPAANSSSGNAHSTQNSGRPSLRPSASTKGDGRRQSGSPVDGAQRRANSQKAWTQGTNPITQRSSFSNGNMARQSGSPQPGLKESNTPDNHAHDRLLFLFASFIGLHTTITTKGGDRFTGIFSSSTLEASESSILLKMVQRASQENQPKTNGVSDASSPYLGSGQEHSMIFDIKDVSDIAVPDVSPAEVSAKESNGASGFRTDADISGNLAMRERTLKRWEPAADEINMSLESTAGDSAGWDQFEANERLFGAKTNYDENLYTTRIDRSDPTYRQKQAEAARIAREIEGQDHENAHMREERGLVAPDSGDQDEESKYSGVQREAKPFQPLVSGQPNKYTPPGRRQPIPPIASTKQTSAPVPQAPAKETAHVEKQQPTPAVQPSAETEQNTDNVKAAPAALTAKQQRPAPDNATANVETEVLDHFRQFASSEKLKVQERRRNQASYDRTVKLNELMKFSKNFKLSTPVPKDLVPILAKDPHKQEAIIGRLQSPDEKASPKPASPVAEQKPTARATGPTGTAPPVAPSDRQNFVRGRQGYPPTGPLAGPGGRFPQQPMQQGRPGAGMLSHRLQDNLQQRKGTNMAPVPAPLPVQDARGPPTGPASDQLRITSPVKSQTSASAASKFNVRAMEFKPNPAASTFTPGGGSGSSAGSGATGATGTAAAIATATAAASASPRSFSRNTSVSRATTPSAFFGTKKPQSISERPSIDDQFNPIKRMKKESAEAAEKAGKPYTPFNGGVPPPYKTLPTWDVSEANQEKTFDQMFKQPSSIPSASPQGRSASNNPHLPQSQMPFYPGANQGMPTSSGLSSGPHMHQGSHGPNPGHMDDHHRMQLSASSSQVFPSPRMGQSHLGYPSPMVPHAQLAFGQPYQGGPQFMSPQAAMGAPMMMPQASNGSYMGVPQGMSPYNPQVQMYSPSPAHAYPQHAPPHQPHSGYPSPSRGAPMMMHQNSQSGQPPQQMMFMSGQPGYGAQQPGHMPPGRGGYPQQQPHFSSSPHQGHHFPPNQHRTPSNSYNQVPQMPSQGPSGALANAGSGSHSAEPTDEGK
ncbi:uncharacterized protein N7477_001046 [Penicillium maclennaniae]|uniref:uncharacterized protein n=1 Tax=Penicillium maclennaniae TaxID=1343394 RepID=UPI002540D43D|nr:uncharacterized protein N7477_001046 [Penicillium maclennaniae]KAJ5684701.1 hypothetical protein N7477_001046 [Penicillium maclennaniae]